MENLGELIKQQRMKLDMPQNELAEKLGITASFLSRIEKGQKKISLARLMEIGEVLGVDFLNSAESKNELFTKWEEVINVFEDKKVTPEEILNFMNLMGKL